LDCGEQDGCEILVVKSDLFEQFRRYGKPVITFDLIVCNPPYVKTAEIGALDRYVLCEPKIALDGGSDGLSFYRRILKDIKKYLSPHGTIILEIGADQADEVSEIAKENGFNNIKAVKDLAKRDRVITLK
jgi:release factor glutamine methyltransferase